ncbi:MAG: zinc-dependent dehydrogenase, partial [bacterium]
EQARGAESRAAPGDPPARNADPMRVAMYYSNNDVRVEDMPVPSVGPGELLVRVEAGGICGSDVMEWYRRHRVPLVLGHEIAGVVAAAGDGVERLKPGDRVSASHHVPCNACRYCLAGAHTVCDTLRATSFDPGGFAEFVRVPALNARFGVYPLPDGVTFEEATFIEPLACVLRAQRKAGVAPGRSVLVLGSGIAGILHVHLARALGASPVAATDVADFRLRAAARLGADAVFHASDDVPSRFREINGGFLADVVVVCTGALPALQQALRSVERHGVVIFFAPADQGASLALPFNELFWRNDVTLTTSYAASPADHFAALELIGSRRVNVREMITHRLPLAEARLGFQLTAAAAESLKVVIEPQK